MISVAFVYVVVVVSDAEVCTLTLSVDVSARSLPNKNLCSTSDVSTRYLVTTYVPSYIFVESKDTTPPLLLDVASDIVTN